MLQYLFYNIDDKNNKDVIKRDAVSQIFQWMKDNSSLADINLQPVGMLFGNRKRKLPDQNSVSVLFVMLITRAIKQ